MKRISTLFFQLHQHIGLLVSLALIAWALSGLAHPIISRINPTAAQFSTPNTSLLPQELRVEKLNQLYSPINALRLFNFEGKNIARVENSTGVHYLDALTLEAIEDFELHYASALARFFVGDDTSAIESISMVNAFDDDYLSVNRLLPVVRVKFVRGDNIRAYLDTQQGRLATLVDDNKAATDAFFRALHTWSWWPSGVLKTTIISALLSLCLLVICMGLWLYIQRWRQGVFSSNARWPMSRRWHAHLNGCTAILALCFVVSGLLHLLVSEERQASPVQAASLQPTTLRLSSNLVGAQWVSSGNLGFWRLQKFQTTEQNRAHHGDAAQQTSNLIYQSEGVAVEDAESQLASHMAQRWWQGSIQGTSPQTVFTNDYGFINKRLPVTKVTYGDGTLLFVEVQTHTLAAQVTKLNTIEGFSFSYLHKWHGLDGLGKDLRDSLLGLVALLIVLGTGLGLYRYTRKMTT